MTLATFPNSTPPAQSREEEEEQLGELMTRLRDRPADFQRIVLGRDLWSKQVEVCDAVARSPITVVPAGRAVGKSFLLAGIVLWWLYTRRNSLVITTGPDHRQVVSVLWKEIRRAIRSSRVLLRFDMLSQGYGSPQRLVVEEGTEWGALGFAAASPEGFSGQHAPDILVIVDEASGVKPEIWGSIDGLVATRVLITGNPLRYDCHFRELHDLAVKGSASITTVPISSLDHPDATKERSEVGAVCAAYLRQMREIHGENSPWWLSNILGRFPGAESVHFLPAVWLDACTNPKTPYEGLWLDYPSGQPCIGVDVGGGVGADRSAVVVRNGKRILEVFACEWHGVLDDARERLEPVVLALAGKWSVLSSRIAYDQSGLGRNFGSYLAAHARRTRQAWLEARIDQPPARDEDGPQLCESALGYFGAGSGGKLFVNRRTKNAFRLKERLDPHRDGYVPLYAGGLPEWSAMREELAELRTPVMEIEEGQVKQKLEKKEDLAARLHRSPDVLDALLMTFTFAD